MASDMGILEKTLETDGIYTIKFNSHLMFSAANNETIKFIGECLINLSEADDYATLVIGQK